MEALPVIDTLTVLILLWIWALIVGALLTKWGIPEPPFQCSTCEREFRDCRCVMPKQK